VNTENVVKHLRALWRTDRIIADIRLRHLLVGLGLRAFAALIAAFGLLMLELSAYFRPGPDLERNRRSRRSRRDQLRHCGNSLHCRRTRPVMP
jgi:hypothetical protein